MTNEHDLRSIPAKKLATLTSLKIAWRLLWSPRAGQALFFNFRLLTTAMTAAFVILISLTGYAYAQPQLKDGDSLYPAKRLGEFLVVNLAWGNAAKAEVYHQLAGRRLYEAGLYLEQRQSTKLSLVTTAYAQTSTTAEFTLRSEVDRQHFIQTLERARYWTVKALQRAETITDPALLDRLLIRISGRQELQVESLNAMIDKLGLDNQKLEVEQVLATLDQARSQQERIEQARLQIKAALDDEKKDFTARLNEADDDDFDTPSSTKPLVAVRAQGLLRAITNLEEQDDFPDKEDIIEKLQLHFRIMNELEASSTGATSTDLILKVAGQAHALETYGYYVADQRAELRRHKQAEEREQSRQEARSGTKQGPSDDEQNNTTSASLKAGLDLEIKNQSDDNGLELRSNINLRLEDD